MDMHRILVIHATPRTLLLHKQKQKQWDVGWCEHVCALYRCPSVCQYAWLHIVIIFGMWGEALAWICTVSWSYMHSHVPCGLRPQDPGSCAYGWLWHGCVLCKCVSDGYCVWGAYNGPYLHVGCVLNMDMYRILVIHAPARAMWIRSTGSRIVCLWVAVAWMRPV